MLFVVLLMTHAIAGVQPDTTDIPDLVLRVAYRQLEDGVPSQSVHHVSLVCSAQECTLTTLTLNQCLLDNEVLGLTIDKGKMYPKIETASTADRNLHVYVKGGRLPTIEIDCPVLLDGVPE